MRVITYEPLANFISVHPESKKPLDEAYKKIEESKARNLVELQQVFPSAEAVGRITVINIKGNKIRLIVAIHYNTQLAYVREVLTHEEYDRDDWKQRNQIYD
jgi:mRNA interferase HigB